MMGPRDLLGVPLAFEEAWPCLSAPTRVETSTELPFTCVLVTSLVLAMCRAVSRERVTSFLRKKGINNMLIWIRKMTFFHTNSDFLHKWIDWLLGFFLDVLSLFLASRKLEKGNSRARPVDVNGSTCQWREKFIVETSSMPSSPEQINT